MILTLLPVLAVSAAGAPATLDFLEGAELQCENEVPVARALLYILEHDPEEVAAHRFPDYGGRPALTASEFLFAHFVPDHAGAVLGDPSELARPEVREVLREHLAGLLPFVSSAPVP
jgi:hypothetical protein